MSGSAGTSSPQISRSIEKLRDMTLLEGAMATAAVVALADRRLAIEETIALKMVLENAESLKMHDPRMAVDIYTRFVDAIRSDGPTGRAEAYAAIGLCADDVDAAETIVRVGVAVAKADRAFTIEELEAIEQVCAAVGIRDLDAIGLVGSRPTRPN